MTAAPKRHPVLALSALGLAIAIFLIPYHLGGRDKLALTATLVRAAGSESTTLTSPIVLAENPRVVLERGTVSIQSSDKAAGLTALLKLLTEGHARLVVDDAIIALDASESDAAVDRNAADTGKSPAAILEALKDMNFEFLTVRSATLVRRTDKGVATEFGTIDADFTLQSNSEIAAKGNFGRNGQRMAFNAAMVLPNGRRESTRLPLKVSLDGPMLKADFSGQLVRETSLHVVAGQSEFYSADAKQLAEWLGAGLIAAPGFKAFSAKGPFEWDGSVLAFQPAQVSIDGNAASGSLALHFGGERLNVEGTLAFAGIDLASYVPDAGIDGSIFALGAGWVLPSISNYGGAKPLLEAVDADLRISADSVKLRSIEIGRGAATLSIKNGRLNANITDIELAQGGVGESQIIVDRRGPVPRLDIRGEITGFDAAEVGRPLLDRTTVSGLATLSGHVTATGETAHKMLSSLDGRLSLTVPGEATIGLNLAALTSPPKADGGPGWGGVLDRSTLARALTLRLTAANGVLSTEAAEVETAAGRFAAAGTIDLRENTIDMTVSRTAAGAADTALREAVRVHGPLAEPEINSTPNNDRADAALPPHPPGQTFNATAALE